MDETYHSKTNRFQFTKGKGGYILHKDNEALNYTLECAALSFHKALIGVSELKALESIASVQSTGGLRISRAVSTYYVIFHLITAAILFDHQNDIVIRGRKLVNGKVPIEVSEKLLNSDSVTPEQWELQKELESDFASALTHTDIKEYCKAVRKGDLYTEGPIKVIYKHFIDRECQTVLYEKACYIRDRVVYRPTIVIEDREGDRIQTSGSYREEIDCLPGWEKLYAIIEEFHQAVLEGYLDLKRRKVYRLFLMYVWELGRVKEDIEDLVSKGFTKQDIDKFVHEDEVDKDDFWVSSYISQLVEVVEIDRLRADEEKLWQPLRRAWNQAQI